MSKTKVHVLVPYTDKAACGVIGPYKITFYKKDVTCPKCKKTKEYKDLK